MAFLSLVSFLGFAAIGGDEPNLRALIAVGEEGDARAVGRPLRRGFALFRRWSLDGFAAVGGDQVDVSDAAIFFAIPFADGVGDAFAVGRETAARRWFSMQARLRW
jgi:hypothetical protein